MNKTKFALLEKAFDASIDAAMHQDPARELIRSKSRYVHELVEEGLLVQSEVVIPGSFPVRVKGYAITERGIFEYSQCC